ncbi:MAG TPA: hypothetical protein VGL02_12530 [Streptomyces sp.]
MSEFDEQNAGLDPGYLKPGGLLMWGFSHHDDFALWSPVGDPDNWPVVIRRDLPYSGPGWGRYDFGIVEFLVRTFHGRLPADPFSGDELWQNTSPAFERD